MNLSATAAAVMEWKQLLFSQKELTKQHNIQGGGTVELIKMPQKIRKFGLPFCLKREEETKQAAVALMIFFLLPSVVV